MSQTPSMKDFLGDGLCLVLEPSMTFSSAIQNCLKDLGVHSNQIQTVRRFRDARDIVKSRMPKLIITEYEVDKFFGMELAELQEKQYDEYSRITFITTRNSSASAIAEAAEGQIDGYLLKPFTIDGFRTKLLDIVARKLNPTVYSRKLNAGRTFFSAGELDQALAEFREAKKLADKPALACSFAGAVFQKKADRKGALQEFQEGRTHQPLHYKCLVGEFDTYVADNNYQAAYGIMELIFKNYPITSRRLGHMFATAVFTKNFQDLPVLFDLFDQLDMKTADLIELTSKALMTAGRFSVRKKDFENASLYFGLGVLVTKRDLNYIEQILTEFVTVKNEERARFFLKQVSETEVGSAAHDRMLLRVDELTLTPEQVVNRGRQMVFEGRGSPEIFRMIVRKSAAMGKESLAEALISKAMETHPEMRHELYKLMDESLPAAAKARAAATPAPRDRESA